MQSDFDKHYPSADIQIIGINEFGVGSDSTEITTDRDLPWLQDVDADDNGVSDVWYDSWEITYRDVVILDADNEQMSVLNVTSNNLANPDTFQFLKSSFLAGVSHDAKSEWRNTLEPLNVNDDDFIAPLDALLVINALSDSPYPGGVLPDGRPEDMPYLDVSNDCVVSPIDALQVINQLTFIAEYDAANGEARDPGGDRSFTPRATESTAVDAQRIDQVATVDQAMAQLSSADTDLTTPVAEQPLATRSSRIDPFALHAVDEESDAESPRQQPSFPWLA